MVPGQYMFGLIAFYRSNDTDTWHGIGKTTAVTPHHLGADLLNRIEISSRVNMKIILYTMRQLTDIKTSSACCKIATRVHPNFAISFIRVGLCTVADGCVRNRVGNLLRSDKAGLEAP